ncbi:hypothetical protein J2S55_009747 [Streptosporangium brasiliense]|uniref:CSD domain-containing protein n=1 Tax=Streptosporangium brasiliense TaxID=47480 RepID=A0ABT9RNW9_9ACTN|nr:hypothetical protein [Streptosporangium brasiliense]
MGTKRPMKATDRRRGGIGDNVKFTVQDTDGAGPPLADIFNDRRKPNGTGKRIA